MLLFYDQMNVPKKAKESNTRIGIKITDKNNNVYICKKSRGEKIAKKHLSLSAY